MKHTNDIDELKRICEAAELEAQAALRDRRAAILRAAAALKAAGKARQKYLRASGAQGDGDGNG